MKENFSKRVQLIIKQSKEEAIRLGHSYVGSEHLLIGLLKEETGLAKKVIDVFDIDSNDMITMVEDMIKPSGGTMTLGHLPLTRRAERILRNAYSEATKRNESIADDEHVLLTLLLESEGIARDILKSFSLDYDTVNDLIGSSEEDDSLSSMNKSKESSEKSTTPTLDHFSRDIIQLAKKGKLDHQSQSSVHRLISFCHAFSKLLLMRFSFNNAVSMHNDFICVVKWVTNFNQIAFSSNQQCFCCILMGIIGFPQVNGNAVACMSTFHHD